MKSEDLERWCSSFSICFVFNKHEVQECIYYSCLLFANSERCLPLFCWSWWFSRYVLTSSDEPSVCCRKEVKSYSIKESWQYPNFSVHMKTTGQYEKWRLVWRDTISTSLCTGDFHHPHQISWFLRFLFQCERRR